MRQQESCERERMEMASAAHFKKRKKENVLSLHDAKTIFHK